MNKFEEALAIKFLKSKRILTTFKKRVEIHHGVRYFKFMKEDLSKVKEMKIKTREIKRV